MYIYTEYILHIIFIRSCGLPQGLPFIWAVSTMYSKNTETVYKQKSSYSFWCLLGPEVIDLFLLICLAVPSSKISS